MFPQPFDDSNFDACVENMYFFIETFRPEMEGGSPIKRDTKSELDISKLDPKRVWSEIQLDTTCITNGFLPASADSRVQGYYVCEKPCHEEYLSQMLFTEILSECNSCAGEGEVNDSECEECEGQGSIYRYLNEVWPGL